MVEVITLAMIKTAAIKYGPSMFSVVKPLIFKDERLAILSGQVDQLLIRELCAAFRIIDGLHTTESEGMKARHLDQAERQLLNGIALDPTLTVQRWSR